MDAELHAGEYVIRRADIERHAEEWFARIREDVARQEAETRRMVEEGGDDGR